jgi:hypothetical protein
VGADEPAPVEELGEPVERQDVPEAVGFQNSAERLAKPVGELELAGP